MNGQTTELEIEPGTTPRGVAREVVKAVCRPMPACCTWFRLSGKDRKIKAGNYEIPAGTTPYELLQKLARGEESLRAMTLSRAGPSARCAPPWRKDEFLKQDTAALSEPTS
jgi:UPF0755 protein